jgi:hypothetical protein
MIEGKAPDFLKAESPLFGRRPRLANRHGEPGMAEVRTGAEALIDGAALYSRNFFLLYSRETHLIGITFREGSPHDMGHRSGLGEPEGEPHESRLIWPAFAGNRSRTPSALPAIDR